MSIIHLSDRAILSVTGDERQTFLQGLITNDVLTLEAQQARYACMLNPQGKILFDFLYYVDNAKQAILLDVSTNQAEALKKRLNLYKLRAAVKIELHDEYKLYASTEEPTALPENSIAARDPRHSALGWRIISQDALPTTDSLESYQQQRIALAIPDFADFIEGRSFTMEFGIAELHGISYNKGCYVGQEIVARSKSRGVLRKALCMVESSSTLPTIGTAIMLGDREVGQLRTSSGTKGLALIRLDALNADTPLMADSKTITAHLPDWFSAALEEKNPA